MALKYPRMECPFCDREVGSHPTRRLGYVSLADHKRERRALVLCPGSMYQVRAPGASAVQEVLPDPVEPVVPVGVEELPLF